MTGGILAGRMKFSNTASKGIKKITGKYNTSKPLTEVKISCPCGLKWTWQDHASPINEEGKEARTLEWIQKRTANFRTHSLKMTQEGMQIDFETLTDMLPLLQATKNPLQTLKEDHSSMI